MKTTDSDVGKYLEMFTLLTKDQVSEIMVQHQKSPEQHYAQTMLANETTELVHGPSGLRKAITATKVLFGEGLNAVSGDHIIEAFKSDANRFIQLERSAVIGAGLDKIASITNAAKSKCKKEALCYTT